MLGRVMLFVLVMYPALAFPQKALWLWNTEEVIARPELRDTLLQVRDELNVEDIFLYFPHRYEDAEGGIHCVIVQEDSITSLVRWASAQGFRIFALAGEPEWSLPEYSIYADAFTHAVLRFSQQLSQDGPIGGIHLDVEPHLLIQFASPVLRSRLYTNMIELHRRLADVIHASSTLEYGVDLPFWMKDSVHVDGRSATVAEHVLQNVDHISVLAYRDEAKGLNGILKLAEAHVAMAEKLRKQVYVGVETQELRFREFRFILGRSESQFRDALSDSCRGFPSVLSGGQRIAAVEVFGTVHVGAPTTALQEDLLRIAECFGRPYDDLNAIAIEEELDEIRFWCRHLGEWKEPRLGLLIDREGDRFLTFSMKEVVLPHVSFWEEPPSYFMVEVARVDSAFGGSPGFRGLAVHDFRGVSSLLLEQ